MSLAEKPATVELCPGRPEDWPIAAYLLGDVEQWSAGRYSLPTVKALLAKGAMQLWFAVVDGAAVAAATTQIITYPTGLKVLSFALLAGEQFPVWAHLVDDFRHFAKQYGCQRIEAITRRGVGRALVKRGWREFQRFHERDV